MNPPRINQHQQLAQEDDDYQSEEDGVGDHEYEQQEHTKQVLHHHSHLHQPQQPSKPKNIGYTRFRDRIEDGFGQGSSKMGLKRTKGDVQGDLIVRSTGTKDRHNKVSTAKGPRDRRVRLAATTAIQFFDVQDRLGCNRPSKAIDWLMKEAKSAIDALEHLPSKISIDTITPYQHDHPILGQNYTTEFSNHYLNNNPTQSLSIDDLQSFQQNPIIFGDQQTLFPGPAPLDFEATPDMDWVQRMVPWNSNSSFSVNGTPIPWYMRQVLGQNQVFSPRKPLQSGFSPSIQIPEFDPRIQVQQQEQIPIFSKSSSILHYQD